MARGTCAFSLLTGFRFYRIFQDIEWNVAKWPFAATLAGLACMAAAGQIMLMCRAF